MKNQSLKAVTFEPEYGSALRSMLLTYFTGDFGFRLNEEDIANLSFDLAGDTARGTVNLHLLLKKELPIGFCISLLDRAENPASIKPGWGFIRDFFILPEKRRLSCGTFLFGEIRKIYSELGAEGLYLTASPAALPFWKHVGFLIPEEPFGRNNEYCLNQKL